MHNDSSKEVFLKEIRRKSIHLCSISIPLLYCITNKSTIIILGIIFFLIMSLFEYSRFSNGKIHIITQSIFHFLRFDINKLIRPHESSNLTGASYLCIATLIILFFYPKNIFIMAFSILAISDSLAALIGIRFGKIKLVGNKTLEGAVTFFISAVLVSYVVCIVSKIDISIWIIIISCFATSVAELMAKKINVDDNLLIPLVFCISMSCLS